MITDPELSKIRVFDTTGEKRLRLLGPGVRSYTLKPDDLPKDSNLVYLSVEGISVASPTRNTLEIQYVLKDGSATPTIIARDSAFITVTDNWGGSELFTFPFKFQWISQHKDTKMLCNAPDRNGYCSRDLANSLKDPHKWNCDHKVLRDDCSHCNAYCVRACIQMLCYYYAYSSNSRIPSQDWISYNVFKDDVRNQLGHGLGISSEIGADQLRWALKLAAKNQVVRNAPKDPLSFQAVANEVLNSGPIICSVSNNRFLSGHVVVILGVRKSNDASEGQYFIADPGDPKVARARWVDADLRKYPIGGSIRLTLEAYMALRARKTDAVESDPVDVGLDTDKDGICDFDEKCRFKDVFDGSEPTKQLNYTQKDTDGDKILDLKEVDDAYSTDY